MATTFKQSEDAVLDYEIQFGDFLDDGETIVSEGTTVTTSDELFVVEDYAVTGNGTSVTAWFSGGALGRRYEIEVTVATSENRVESRRFYILVTKIYI